MDIEREGNTTAAGALRAPAAGFRRKVRTGHGAFLPASVSRFTRLETIKINQVTPEQFDPGPGLTSAVVLPLLHDAGSKMPSVEAIYLRPDGLEFVMTGSDPSPDMYEACADVAARVQAAVDPTGASYVEGGWRRDHLPIEGWLVAYSR
jgi:hypothetical protein